MHVRVRVCMIVEVRMIRAVGKRVPVLATVAMHMHLFHSTSIRHGCG